MLFLMQTGMLLAFFSVRLYCWLVVSSRLPGPQGLSLQSCFPAFRLQHVLVPGVVPLQVQDFAVLFVELHEIPLSPVLQPVQIPLDGSTATWCISRSSQYCVICKLAEVVLCPIVQVVNKDVRHYWPQF